MFDINDIYNTQNQRISAACLAEANRKDGIKMRQNFPTKVMLWLGVFSKEVTPLIVFEQKETVDHPEYIQKLLPIALKNGNHTFREH